MPSRTIQDQSNLHSLTGTFRYVVPKLFCSVIIAWGCPGGGGAFLIFILGDLMACTAAMGPFNTMLGLISDEVALYYNLLCYSSF